MKILNNMLQYNKTEPLISIHIPKTAGTTFRECILPQWDFKCIMHYDYHGTKKFHKMPYIDLSSITNKDNKPIIIHGHFFKGRNGIEEYYPNVKQFITILREPFEAFVSLYYYCFKLECAIPKITLSEWVKDVKTSNLNLFMPQQMTLDNYQSIIENNFVEIGITEMMEESMIRMSRALDQPFEKEWLNKKQNIGNYNRDTTTQKMRDEFRETHQLEYAIYNYVVDKYK